MAEVVAGQVPKRPVDLDGVVLAFPEIRQSLASTFDECELSALFNLRYENGWSTSPMARGTLFHRAAGEILRTMREQDTEAIPVEVAEAILEDVVMQRGIPPHERVRLPLRELPFLEMTVRKFARDNAFSVRKIIDVERRLKVDLEIPSWGAGGGSYTRTLTGQIDALIARPPDEAIILDWKHTWRLPPQREEDREADADEPGFFQLMWYGWLVFKTYPAVQAVSLREFYVARTKARAIRLTRQELPKIERRLQVVVGSFDRAVASGAPKNLRLETVGRHGAWFPQPGKHCFDCAARARCPIDDLVRGDGNIRTALDAEHWANVRTAAKALHKRADQMLQPWAERNGPIPIRSSRAKRVLGYRGISRDQNGNPNKTRWEEYSPSEDDVVPVRNPDLEGAMRRSVEEARAARQEHVA